MVSVDSEKMSPGFIMGKQTAGIKFRVEFGRTVVADPTRIWDKGEEKKQKKSPKRPRIRQSLRTTVRPRRIRKESLEAANVDVKKRRHVFDKGKTSRARDPRVRLSRRTSDRRERATRTRPIENILCRRYICRHHVRVE